MSSSNFISKAAKSISAQAKKLIVLGGGVGPAAGSATHDQIIRMTDNGKDKDQGHASLIEVSFSGSINDRTAWLKSDGKGPNPGAEMAKAINRTLMGHMQCPGNMVLGVPCNTFHSKGVWDKFNSDLEHPERITVVNMIEETAKKILKTQKQRNKVIISGLLSTIGTRDTGVYNNILKEYHIEMLTLDDENQEKVTKAIYDPETGIKGQNPDMLKNRKLIDEAIESLRSRGASLFILGCTELPLPYQELGTADNSNQERKTIPSDCIDPANILAKTLLRKSGHVLKAEYDSDDEDNEPTGAHGNDFLNLAPDEDDDGFSGSLEKQDMSKMEDVE